MSIFAIPDELVQKIIDHPDLDETSLDLMISECAAITTEIQKFKKALQQGRPQTVIVQKKIFQRKIAEMVAVCAVNAYLHNYEEEDALKHLNNLFFERKK